MFRSLAAALFLFAGSLPFAAGAHPHEFIDTGITFGFGQEGRLEHVGIVWVWDELTSLLIVEDLEMDGDGDGILTGEERARLTAEFADWPPEFDGALHLWSEGRPVALSGPQEVGADYVDGRVTVRFRRGLTEEVDPGVGAVSARTYDPSYYVFYSLAQPPGIAGREDCEIEIREADIVAARRLYDQLLATMTEAELMEEGKSPEVGHAFADEVRLTCAGR